MSKSYRARFQAVIDEIRACPVLELSDAEMGPPTDPAVLAAAKKRAGGAWPMGMTELYSETSFVRLAYSFRDAPSDLQTGGAIDLPTVDDVWDHEAHEGQIWFSDPELDHPDLRRIRPIDRFVPEQYATLYPVPSDTPPLVHLFNCNEDLSVTDLTYHDWLELLLLSRGAYYWLSELVVPRTPDTDRHFHENFDRVAGVLGFDPVRFRATIPKPWIDLTKH